MPDFSLVVVRMLSFLLNTNLVAGERNRTASDPGFGHKSLCRQQDEQ